MTRGLALLPHIRDIFSEASPSIEGRERVMHQLNRYVHDHPRCQRLPQRVQMFVAGYIHRCLEERYNAEE